MEGKTDLKRRELKRWKRMEKHLKLRKIEIGQKSKEMREWKKVDEEESRNENV